MPETTALGVAMAAGSAEGVRVWSLDPRDLTAITTDVFEPSVTEKGIFGTLLKWLQLHFIQNNQIVPCK